MLLVRVCTISKWPRRRSSLLRTGGCNWPSFPRASNCGCTTFSATDSAFCNFWPYPRLYTFVPRKSQHIATLTGANANSLILCRLPSCSEGRRESCCMSSHEHISESHTKTSLDQPQFQGFHVAAIRSFAPSLTDRLRNLLHIAKHSHEIRVCLSITFAHLLVL
jgi:hypothetical protein